MSPWPELEEDLRDPVAQHLADQGLTVRHEVWINGRIADLYAFDDAGTTVAIELKLTDWKQATVQAMAYQLGALYTYVALPVSVVPDVAREATRLKRHNIGLMAVSQDLEAPSGFQTADEAPTPDAVDAPPVQAQVRTVFEAHASERYLPFLAEKIVREAKRPKRRSTILPMD